MSRRISDNTLQQVKQFSGIVDYIQQFVDLKRKGRNYLGLCPFHSEKTPSFTVSAEKQIFHCFGCHESGDLIAFAEKIDNLT
ncbi:DNA primase, partial [Candidatus Marinamargulisbacteria bacterium SCGC AG-343-D04]